MFLGFSLRFVLILVFASFLAMLKTRLTGGILLLLRSAFIKDFFDLFGGHFLHRNCDAYDGCFLGVLLYLDVHKHTIFVRSLDNSVERLNVFGAGDEFDLLNDCVELHRCDVSRNTLAHDHAERFKNQFNCLVVGSTLQGQLVETVVNEHMSELDVLFKGHLGVVRSSCC